MASVGRQGFAPPHPLLPEGFALSKVPHGLSLFAQQLVTELGQAASLPGDVFAGRVDPNSDEAIQRAADLAGLVTMGARGVPGGGLRAGAGSGFKATPVEHDPFDITAAVQKIVKNLQNENLGDWEMPPALHTGEPTNVGIHNSKGWSQDTYSTPDGGEIEFVYDKNGLPNHAVKWTLGPDGQLGSVDMAPDEVFFPAKAKPELHKGEPSYVGTGFDTYATAEGGSIDYHFHPNGDPNMAQLWGPGGNPLDIYEPDQVKFPRKLSGGDDQEFKPGDDDWVPESESNEELASMLNDPVARQSKIVPAEWQETYSSLQKHETEAVSRYTASDYYDINKTLLGHLSPTTLEPGRQAQVTGWIKSMDEALAKSRLPADTTLYRGVGPQTWNILQDLEPGDVWTSPTFTSTSIDRQAAKDFSKGPMIHILAPKGTSGLYVPPISLHPHEKEVLLPRGQQFRVKYIDPEARLIELEPLPPSEGAKP